MFEIAIAFDPLCGWCFGFHAAVDALRRDRPDLPLEICLGGLVTQSRIGPYADQRGYITAASDRLEAVTGRRPSRRFVERILHAPPEVLGSSLPPSIAIHAVRASAPSRAIDFAHAVQDAHFVDGKDLNQPETYLSILEQLGLDLELPDLGDGRTAPDEVLAEFERTRERGGTSFPTLLVSVDGVERPHPPIYDPAGLVRWADHTLPREPSL